jgi:hypothetical protein
MFSHERDLRTKVNDALQRYGIKQVDLARDTGKYLITGRNSSFYSFTLASRKTKEQHTEIRRVD